MNRDKVIATVNALPPNFELDVLLERLIFVEKVEQGMKDIENGDIFTHEEILQQVKEWQK